MKKLFKGLAAVCAAAVCAGMFAGCGEPAENGKQPGLSAASAFVAVDINPSVELTVDANGIVVSARAANADAEVLLVDVELAGLTVEQATQKIVELSAQMGYIDENNTDVRVTTVTEDPALEQEINQEAAAGAESGDARVTVFTESTRSLEREVKKLTEANPNLAGLTPAKLRLAKAAMNYDSTLTIEAAAGMTVQELMDIVKSAHENYGELLTDGLKDEYERKLDEAEAEIDAQIDAVYGEDYAAMRDVERRLEAWLDAKEDELEAAEEQAAPGEEQLIQLVAALKLESVEQLKQAVGGEITLRSLEEYLDRLEDEYDKTDDEESEELEEALDGIEDILDELEESAEFDEDNYRFTEAELAELEEILAADSERPAIAGFEDAEDYLEALEERNEEAKEELEKSLTEEQKRQIKELEKQKKQVKKEIKGDMKKDIADAKAELKQLKEERKAGKK